MSTVEKPAAYPQQPAYTPQQPGYPPQQSGYPPQQGYTTTTTIVQQPTVVIAQSPFLENPVSTQCPMCKATIVTGTHYVTGTLTWLACFGLCIVGCDLGCCFIPFCIDSLKDVIHTCPNCQAQVGVYRRM